VELFRAHSFVALCTLDVARRLANVLINALSFANNFIFPGVEDPSRSDRVNKGLTLRERESLLKTRIHQCFNSLGFPAIQDSTQTILLQSALSSFASPEGYAGSSVQAAIASSTGTFVSVWTCADGYGLMKLLTWAGWRT
jgi:HEAT repeat-containing protein 5